jgi:hypothetical protein
MKIAPGTILMKHHRAVMARSDAVYFIKEWQDLRDRVRILVTADARYKTAKGTKGNGN